MHTNNAQRIARRLSQWLTLSGAIRWSAALARAKRGCVSLFVLILLISNPIAVQSQEATASQVKAAFLLNFPKYIEWPAESFPQADTPIVVGVYGDEKVASDFERMSNGKTINNRAVRLKRISNTEDAVGCQIVFIGVTDSEKAAELLRRYSGTGVLTVGETDGFLESGGIVNLVRRDRKIRLHVNLPGARKSELRISSKLLAVSDVVK